MNQVVVVILLLSGIVAIEGTSLYSVDKTPSYPPCNITDSSDCGPKNEKYSNSISVNPYDQMVVYVYVQDEWTRHQWVATFWPRLDEFAMLGVPLSYASFGANPNITVWASVYTMNTTTVHYSLGNSVAASWTLIVNLDNGFPISVNWDAGCSACLGLCIDNACGVDKTQYCATGYNCDMKIYLACSGNATNLVPCTSINSIPSAFNQLSVVPAYQYGLGLVDDVVYSVKNSNPPPIGDTY